MSDRANITAVTFKDEDEVDGVAIGPVSIIDIPRHEAWMKANYPDGMIPFGIELEGITELGWKPLPEALEIAREHGVELGRY